MKYELTSLELLLDLWEDNNRQKELFSLFADLTSHLGLHPEFSQALKVTAAHDYAKPLPHYPELRKLLEKNDPVALDNFDIDLLFPPIPTDQKGRYTTKAGYAISNLFSLYVTPMVVSLWAHNKKVCTINKSDLIPDIFPGDNPQEQYLDKLPYGVFLLDLAEPLRFTGKLLADVTSLYKHIIVINLGDNQIVCFGIPEKLDEFIYSEEDLKKVTEAIEILRKACKLAKSRTGNMQKNTRKVLEYYKEIKRLFLSIDSTNCATALSLPFHLMYDMHDNAFSNVGFDIVYWNDADFAFRKRVISIVNGVSKLLYEHTAEMTTVFHSVEKDDAESTHSAHSHASQSEQPIETFEWYEVPDTHVDYLKLKRYKGGVKVSIVRSHEKSPHVRRSHQRHYRDENGKIIKTVQIKQAQVRIDLIKKGEPSKSGVLAMG